MDTLAQTNPAEGLPASVHTEVTILGAMMLDGVAVTDALAKLQAEDFSLDSHQKIYRCLWDMIGCDMAIDYTTVREELTRRRELDSVGGPAYLAYLTEGVPRNINIESYVQIVKDKALLRQLMAIFNEGANRAGDQSEDAVTVLADIETLLAGVAQSAVTGGFATIEEIVAAQPSLERFLIGSTEEGSIRVGFAFDGWTNGLKAGQLIVIAARPSMGKTAWAMNAARNSAIQFGKKVGILTLEMSKEELLRRMIGTEAQISKHKFATNTLTDEERRRSVQAIERLIQTNIFIDDKPFTTMQEIRAKARRLKQKHGLDLLVIDYLGLIETLGKSENRNQEVSAISRGLKGLAKELGIPIICLAQLNRKCEERADKRPMLSDLRDSGAIEQDADIVAFIYRDEVYEPDNPEFRNKAEFIVAKHRDGRIGTMRMTFVGDCTLFVDQASPDQEANYGR